MKKDLSGKNLLNCPDVFADIGNVNLFDGEPMIRPEDLERQSTELVYKDDYGTMRHHFLDTRMKMTRQQTDLAIFCIENQSGISNIMPVRDLGYLFSNYSDQIRNIQKEDEAVGMLHFTEGIGKERKLVPVVSLVLYYGQEDWSGPEKLSDMLSLPEPWDGKLKPYIADHQVKVIHLAKQDPETRKKYQSDFRHIVDYLSCARDRQECQNYIWDTERKICHPEEYLDMMAAFSSDTRFAQIRETIVKRMKKGEGEVTMFSIAEELENIGKEKGIEQGKEQTYYRMFRNHKTPEDISEFSGESLEYLCHIHEKYLELVQEESQ